MINTCTGRGEDHEHLIPIISNLLDQSFQHSIIKKKGKILLKSDGMLANVNVGAKCLDLLKEKYAASGGKIHSSGGKHIYILGNWYKNILV